jgi:hypothetical protein
VLPQQSLRLQIMDSKFELYDVIGILIPGAIALGLSCIAFPDVANRFSTAGFPQAFSVICLIAVAMLFGQLIQAVASLLEPLLYWTWRGRPSERALKRGLGNRYFPIDSAQRIRAKLARSLGTGVSDRSLFLYAMQRAETSGNPRVARFNALFAYHRAMLALIVVGLVLVITSMRWGAIARWPLGEKTVIVAAIVALLLITWVRAKQRGYYYVREVLFTAERLIDGAASPRT